MGKSTMLKKLRKECDSKFWITAIDLKTHNEFLKTKHDINDLLDYLLEGNQDDFSDQIRNIFGARKRWFSSLTASMKLKSNMLTMF
jgi:hypothetical protein